MKKLFIAVLTLVTLSAVAQPFQSRSFLNCQSVTVSNTVCVTNLLTVTASVATNVAGLVFTNYAGVRDIVPSGAYTNENGVITNMGAVVNLLKIMPLWVDRNGSSTQPGTNTGLAYPAGPYNGNIFIRLKGGSGANSAVTFVFAPVPSDTLFEDTTAADLIKVAVTANTSTWVTSLTPLDRSRLIGCKALMLREIFNADADASSQVTVYECTLNGFVP